MIVYLIFDPVPTLFSIQLWRKPGKISGGKFLNFTHHHLNEFTISKCETKVDEINAALETAAEAITNLFEDYDAQMSQELKDDYNKTYQQLFDDVKIQILNF